MVEPAWKLIIGDGPLVATAVHDGHDLRADVAAAMCLGDAERRREEDPFTDRWTKIAPTRIVVHRSRFEVDLNRPRDAAVYRKPADCWGLTVWQQPPAEQMLRESLALYDGFYQKLKSTLDRLLARHPRLVVYDLHTYNHRRDGASGATAPAAANPEVNLGTGTLDRQLWSPVVDRFLADLRSFDFFGRRLDVRENVRFRGGQLVRWLHETYPGRICGLAIEVKKFFMDEWTGRADEVQLEWVGRALASTTPGVLAALSSIPL